MEELIISVKKKKTEGKATQRQATQRNNKKVVHPDTAALVPAPAPLAFMLVIDAANKLFVSSHASNTLRDHPSTTGQEGERKTRTWF